MVDINKDLDFEQTFNKLEELVNKLESGQESLEKSLELFEEGIKLTQVCREKLDNADQKIKELIKKSDSSFELKDIS